MLSTCVWPSVGSTCKPLLTFLERKSIVQQAKRDGQESFPSISQSSGTYMPIEEGEGGIPPQAPISYLVTYGLFETLMYCDPPPQAGNPMSMYALEGNEKEPFSQGFAMFAQHVCHAILRGRGNPRSRTVWYIIHHIESNGRRLPPGQLFPTIAFTIVFSFRPFTEPRGGLCGKKGSFFVRTSECTHAWGGWA